MEIPKDKKIYFSSDNHLGLPSLKESHDREKIFVKWLDSIKHDAEIIFLLGDLFDFWFEYKEAVPRGFTRSLGKLAELSDMGIKIYFFVGNHEPHKDRRKEYINKIPHIGLNEFVDAGQYESNKPAKKVSTYSHYTSKVLKIVKF